MEKKYVNQIAYGQIQACLTRKLTKLELIFSFSDKFEFNLCSK